MQIYTVTIEVDLENYQSEAIEAVDELIVTRVDEIKSLARLVTNTTVDTFITRQGPYAAAVPLEPLPPGVPTLD